MSIRRILIFPILLMILSVGGLHISGQYNVDEICAQIVLEALEAVEMFCSDVGENNACYAHEQVDATPVDGEEITFATLGDQANLADIQSLHTSPVNVDLGEWGIALINMTPLEDGSIVEATPDPDADDSEEDHETTSFMMLGDVTMTNLTAGISDVPQAFTFSTAEDDSVCLGAPNKLVIQNPDGVITELSVNGAEITLQSGATIVLDAIPSDEMTVLVVTGEAIITSLEVTQIVLAGEMVVISLGGDDGLVVISIPSVPIVFDNVLIQFIPFQFLLETVEIPSYQRWVATGVDLTAGQSYFVVASELVKTIDYMPWASPEGHSPADCASAGRGDWDCRCRTSAEWGTCTLEEGASMILLGRVGDDAPFIVGSGGVFTARVDGELWLGANDNTFTDNVGSFYAVITTLTNIAD